jgi:N-acetyl-anhydromuramyl-L-alanine amidase AmpD
MAPLFDNAGWYTKAVNYKTAEYRASRFYPGNSGRLFVCLHISDGTDSRAWLSTSPTSQVSAHFLNREDGIYQHVSINDSAWANGIWESGHAYRGLAESENPNRWGISIENEGRPNRPIGPTQQQQLISLLRDLAQQYAHFRPYVPGVSLIRHTDISPAHRPNCPGPLFDFAALAAAANGASRRYRVRADVSDDPTTNYAAVRVEPSISAAPALIGPNPVRLEPGWVVGVDAERGGWLHIAEPAAWGWSWGGLYTPVAAAVPIGPPAAAPDLAFAAPPRITQAMFARVLAAKSSPSTADAAALYAIPLRYGLDPAVALAFFYHESECGTKGRAVETRNWGNIRRGQGHEASVHDGFARYTSWANALEDWCLLITRDYINPLVHNTPGVRAALRIYAPPSDGNAPDAYADVVMALVSKWQKGRV